ncbi:MAG: glycosyltransferase family 2 protein [Xenococcaceae cyanobacterium MO_207.B15]|nr:glycosyltransferase family 2 protein [Xenococcaceae cyanobacterium MO_207.B15]
MSKITTIIPTYRRPKDLERCLKALKKQTRLADEVIVIVRDIDRETETFLKTFNPNCLSLRTVMVSIPGQVAALNAGLDAASGDIIAITDDDAMPYPDWLKRIENNFLADGRVGGVGGRDLVYHGTKLVEGKRDLVGQLQWSGRTIGNHHLGYGNPREVDILKGANMSFRRQAVAGLRFDERLRGTGAQVHNDMAFCLALKRSGWKLIYDPMIRVDHYPAQRFDEDERNKFNDIALINAVHNETLTLLEHLPPLRRVLFLIWINLIGTRQSWGCVQWLRFLPSEGLLAGRKWLASIIGRWQGCLTWGQNKGDRLEQFQETNSKLPLESTMKESK